MNQNVSSVEPVAIPGAVAEPSVPQWDVPAGACDCHAHLFGPASIYPFTEGRGYTPPEAPRERYIEVLDRLKLSRGIIVQGNAHGLDNRVVLDAVAAYPDRLRGVVITDQRTDARTLADWHKLGIRGLRFHVHSPVSPPNYARGVGLDVFESFRTTLMDLGWVAQFLCDWQALPHVKSILKSAGRGLPIILDHMTQFPAKHGVQHPSFQTMLELLSEGYVNVKLSGYVRIADGPGFEDAVPMHEALIAANPDGLIWGTDWPHTQVAGENLFVPDDGALIDLFAAWTPDPALQKKILVDNPQRLFWQ